MEKYSCWRAPTSFSPEGCRPKERRGVRRKRRNCGNRSASQERSVAPPFCQWRTYDERSRTLRCTCISRFLGRHGRRRPQSFRRSSPLLRCFQHSNSLPHVQGKRFQGKNHRPSPPFSRAVGCLRNSFRVSPCRKAGGTSRTGHRKNASSNTLGQASVP